MEEVWKDINLGTLNEEKSGGGGSGTRQEMNLGGVMFQDFLGNINIDPHNSILSSVSTQSGCCSLYCPPPSAPSPAPPLVTALSLSSRPLPLPLPLPLNSQPSSTLSSLTSLPCSKRFLAAPDCSLGDRRNKRMIKNRESAARSRARKQAYTNELELEVAHLKEENARLRRKQQQLSEAATNEQKRKGTLCRASTAPF